MRADAARLRAEVKRRIMLGHLCAVGRYYDATTQGASVPRSCAASSRGVRARDLSSRPRHQRGFKLARRKIRCRCTSTTCSRSPATCPGSPGVGACGFSGPAADRAAILGAARRARVLRAAYTTSSHVCTRATRNFRESPRLRGRHRARGHAQLLTRSKMFCGCPTTFGAAPTPRRARCARACPACCRWSIASDRARDPHRLAFGCRVNPACRFAASTTTTHMPKNYQISQYEEPLAEEGFLEIDSTARRARSDPALHLEETRQARAEHPRDRAGEPVDSTVRDALMETVSASLRSPKSRLPQGVRAVFDHSLRSAAARDRARKYRYRGRLLDARSRYRGASHSRVSSGSLAGSRPGLALHLELERPRTLRKRFSS